MQDQTSLWIALISTIISSGVISAIIISILNRKKIKAEIDKMETSSEIQVGKIGLEYAKTFKEELDALRKRLKSIEDDYDLLVSEHMSLKIKYKELENKYDLLQISYAKAKEISDKLYVDINEKYTDLIKRYGKLLEEYDILKDKGKD